MASSQARRAWLESAVRQDATIRVIGTAPTFPFLRSLLNEIEADVALIEPGAMMPSEQAEEWLQELPELVPVVLFVPESDSTMFSHLVRTQRGGMLRSDAPADQIVQTVKAVATGLLTFDPALIPHPDTPSEIAETLTPREHDVLALLAEGLPNRQIASRLNISEHTIKFHIRSILGKLGASSRTEAVTVGLRSGIIEL
jgi:DNA-binding NarL/FixJ family response regulator